MISAEVNTPPDLVEVCKEAYASMIGPDGSFPGAELIGLVALRQAWAVWKQTHKHNDRSRMGNGQKPAWRSLEIGAGRGGLARYTAQLGRRMHPGRPIWVSLLEPVLEQNRALVNSLSTLQAQGRIDVGNLHHLTFAEFLENRERDRIAWLDMPLYNLVVLIYSFAALLAEADANDATATASLLKNLISLLDRHGILVIADRSIDPDSPNAMTMTVQDSPKLLRLADAIWKAAWFFGVWPAQVRSLCHDLVRIQQEPGWGALAAVHHEAACRGQQLETMIRALKRMPSVTHRVLDFGGNWILLVWRQAASER